MPLTPEQRSARSRLAAVRRHHGPDAAVPEESASLEQAGNERFVEEAKARRPKLSPEQVAVLRRVFKYGPASEEVASG